MVLMLRSEYNVISFRVLCASLLAITVTFTVILTNVFIDIDLSLSNKNKPDDLHAESYTSNIISGEYEIIEEPADHSNDDDFRPNGVDSIYRTKRSIESDNFQSHGKDPNIKKILTSRLASLLKELDEETTPETATSEPANNFEKLLIKENKNNGVRNEDLLHLAMHNILLQGMIGHMDLNDVYNKVHVLVNNFNNVTHANEDRNSRVLDRIVNSKENIKARKYNSYNDEHKFFEELIKCKKLENQIDRNGKKITGDNYKDKDKIYINAVIEINDKNKINITNSTENIEGIIKLIYNGKPIKINNAKTPTEIDGKLKEVDTVTVINEKKNIAEHTADSQSNKENQNYLLNKLIAEYMKTHPPDNAVDIKDLKTIRMKRQANLNYFDDETNDKPLKNNKKPEDDDIYIEIESHFNGKGLKGGKKNKLVKSLIEKIEKALKSDVDKTNKIDEYIKFTKRTQDPILANHILLDKIPPPHDRIEHRELDPIDKTLTTHENVLKTAVSWKDQLETPRFLSLSKSVNSAEMSQLNIDYDTVLNNGVPKRLQQPISTNMNNYNTTASIDNDPNNVTLFLKDIDGTGFSVGINRYIGEAPDNDSMKMFNGLENLIKEFHQNYDQEVSNESDTENTKNFFELNNEVISSNDRNIHKIKRRGINGSNTFNRDILFKNNVTFEKSFNIFKRNNKLMFQPTRVLTKENSKEISKFYHLLFRSNINDANEKRLTLTKASDRRKRSLKVKKISNVRSKIKLSRFINTNAMASKKIFLRNKRNKRQINRIRIIARDREDPPKNSDENLFMISREDTYTDKAVIAYTDKPLRIGNIKSQDHYDEVFPIGEIYRVRHNMQPIYSDIYDTKRSSNALMTKYPHIFINNDSGSNEDDLTNDNVFTFNEKPYRIQTKPNLKSDAVITNTKDINSDKNIPVEEIINAIIPQSSKPFKLTLKIKPKTLTNQSTGFEEVHTSVNKSFDDNGLRFFSLLNVSQISKIEKLNKTIDVKQEKKETVNIKPLNHKLKEQQNQIKALLQLHKRRVDTQLGNLLRESKHLENMLDENSKNNINETISILHDDIITNAPSDDKINKILTSIKKLQETIKNKAKIEASSTKPTTPKPDIENLIKSHEKVTSEILRRIDTNTNVLKEFLQTFTSIKTDKSSVKSHTIESPNKIKTNLTDDPNNYANSLYGKNENINATIPFVYTYQQNKGPLASMIYQGHIHTNALQNTEQKPVSDIRADSFNNISINRRKSNGSKFFMDEFENDFKVAPNKPFVAANIKINTTHV